MNVPRIRLRWRSLSAPATALLLALALTLGVTAAPIGAQATDSTEITDMSEQDYKTLGLETNEDIPEDTSGPYSQTKKTTVVTRSEVYMAANGAKGNRYTLRDKLENVQTANLGNSSKLADSFGNIWGAAKFWSDVNDIDHGSDLYNQSDYGGGDWSHLSDNGSDTVLANESSGFSGIHATSVELCLDAELGKKSYVAELRAYGDDLSTKIDGKSYKGLVKVSIFAFDSNNNYKRFWVGDLFTTVNTNMMYEDGFKYLREGYLQELDGVFNITAGDVDGDGMDEIFAYTGCYVDEDGQRKAVIDMFDLENGSTRNAQHKVLKVDAGTAANYTVKAQGSDCDAAWTQLQSCPVVTLAAGDLDRDFKDDLAITVSAPYGKSNIAEATYCELYTWNDDTLSLTHVNGIGDNGRIVLSSGGKIMLGANATFGTFAKRDENGIQTSDTVTGLIVAGYEWEGAAYDVTRNWPDEVDFRYVYYDDDNAEFKISAYQHLPREPLLFGPAGTAFNTYVSANQAKRYACTMAPLALCTANLDGLTTPTRNDYILVGGTIYKGFACTVGKGANALGTEFGTMSMSEQHYNASNKHDHKGIDHTWISDVKAGCVSGSDDYRESFIAVVGSHRDEDLTKPDDYYWMTASHATLGQDGKLITGEEEIITESNRRNTRYGTFVSLALPDVDKDSVQIEFDEAYKVYTNPRVLAVLQDSPYYRELQDAYGYLVLGGTGYGEGKGSGSADGAVVSGELGFGFEAETGWPLFFGKAEFEIAAEAGYEYQHEKTVNFSVTYESHAGEGNKVVVYTLPMVYYVYNAVYEETGDKGCITAPVALGAETSVVSQETYDEIAESHNMTPISYFLSNTSGHPETYESNINGDSDQTVSDSFGLGKKGVSRVYTSKGFIGTNSAAGASITQEIETETADSHQLEVGATVNGSFMGGFKINEKHDAAAGMVYGLSAGYTHEWLSSDSNSYEGTVDNLPEAAKDDYGFQWRLGVNAVDKDKFEAGSDGQALGTKDTDQFWIIGYDVRGEQKPDAPAVTGFAACAATDTSVTFNWDDVLPEGSQYHYGIGMLGSSASNATVTSWKLAPSDTTELVWDGLEPNREYHFAIAVVDENEPKGIRSAVVSVKTMPEGMRFNVEGPQATVQLAGTENALNETTGLEYNSSITAASGQQVTLRALGSLDNENEDAAKPKKLYYTWFRKGRSDPVKREELYQGEISALTIDIPTDSKAINEEQGAQYYCQIGYNDVALNTGTTLIKIERLESQLQATNRVNRPALLKLATLLQANANLFLDHSLVNTGTGADESENPGTNDGANKPDDTKKPSDTKKPVTAATTQAKLSNTGDKTFAVVAGIAAAGLVLVGAGLLIAKRKRK